MTKHHIRHVGIEPADNGGFVAHVEKRAPESKSKDIPTTMDEISTRVFGSHKDLIGFLDEILAPKGSEGKKGHSKTVEKGSSRVDTWESE